MSGGVIIAKEAAGLIAAKWQRGEREHGGDLFRKPVLHEAIEEAVDLIAYLLVLRRQVDMARLYLQEAVNTNSVESTLKAYNLLTYGNAEGEGTTG